MNATLLQVDKIEVVYKRVITAVQGVTLAIPDKQIVALLGTNGAGKTTTLRAISGFLGIDDARVTEGSIAFQGAQLVNRPPHEIAGRGVVLVPEREKVFPNLTVAENLIAPVPRNTGGRRRSSSTSSRASPTCARASAGCSRAANGRCWRSPAR